MPKVGLLYESEDQYVVSPKLENSGNLYSKRYKPKVLRYLREQGAYFKFVVTGLYLDEFAEIYQIVAECGIAPGRVMIMPCTTTPKFTNVKPSTEQILTGREIVKEVLSRGYGLSLRQHVLLWEDERGR